MGAKILFWIKMGEQTPNLITISLSSEVHKGNREIMFVLHKSVVSDEVVVGTIEYH